MSDTIATDDGDTLVYEHQAAQAERCCFVFFNPLTGDFTSWKSRITPPLVEQGHGYLLFNYRGQPGSSLRDDVELTAERFTEDAALIARHVQPSHPIYVGHSIGGLFAVNLHRHHLPARALVLINTLREEGPRLRWINDATHRAALTGGPRLLRDLYVPLLFGEAWQAENRANFLTPEAYAPLPPGDPTVRLLASSATARWDVPWHELSVPGAILSGLQDRVFYDAEVVNRLADQIPNVTRADVPEAGHMLPAETPELVVKECLALAEGVAYD